MIREVLDIFNVVETDNILNEGYNFDLIEYGYVLDFNPSKNVKKVLIENQRKLPLTTFFTVDQRKNMSVDDLMALQVMEYVATYALNAPGMFNLTNNDGHVMSLRYVHGASRDEIQNLVNDLIYRNAPIKDIDPVKTICGYYDGYEFNKIQNNDLRVALFNPNRDTFKDGDDAIRWIMQQSGSDLLIKSGQVLRSLAEQNVSVTFLARHVRPLSKVFNRHKKVFMAIKNPTNATVINRISRLSKHTHTPVRESISKTFVTKALNGHIQKYDEVLAKISLRDKFKYLNLLEWKLRGNKMDAFIVRNGRIHIEQNRPVFKKNNIQKIIDAVIESIKIDLSHLGSKSILLDAHVDFGLPVSQKQTVGKLPFGTTITVTSDRISAGVHWKNTDGIYDLDLSAIGRDGTRVGWGSYGGYGRTDVVYSGDVTYAQGDGAMEFMTSDKVDYAMFSNIFNGNVGSTISIVIGECTDRSSNWIDKVQVQEQMIQKDRQYVVGFVKGKTFVVYGGRLGNQQVSQYHPVVERGFAKFWTVKTLLDAIGVQYDTVARDDVQYDINLVYSEFSYDKLEAALLD